MSTTSRATLLCCFIIAAACSGTSPSTRVDVKQLTETLAGPFRRETMIVGTVPRRVESDSDPFEYAVINGHPRAGSYDWFKIAKSPIGGEVYLVAGSKAGDLEWVERGEVARDPSSHACHFVVERVTGAEGDREKNVREFSWNEREKALTLTVTEYKKFAFSPSWGEPSRFSVSFTNR